MPSGGGFGVQTVRRRYRPAFPGSRSGTWTPEQVRGDNRGDKEGKRGRAAIRVPIRRKGRKSACTNALHPVQRN